MNILSRNSNGLGFGDHKVRWFRSLITKHRIDFMGIQETKRKNLSDIVIKRIWGSMYFDFVSKGSNGRIGGLVSIWNKNLFKKEQSVLRDDCIIFLGRWTEKSVPISFINIFASKTRPKERSYGIL